MFIYPRKIRNLNTVQSEVLWEGQHSFKYSVQTIGVKNLSISNCVFRIVVKKE